MAQLADITGEHHRPCLLQRRDIAIGEVHHRHQAGALGGVGHLRRLGVIFRERLFAQHVLAGGKQCQRRRVVRLVRRHVRRRVELAPGDRLVERGEGLGNAVLVGKGTRTLGVDIDRADHLDAFDFGKGLGMAVRHAAGSNYKKTHDAHLYPASPAWCSRGPRSTIGSSAFSTGTFGASWIAV
ncbi:hypothetical protein D9M70_495080 [compost metagenome]